MKKQNKLKMVQQNKLINVRLTKLINKAVIGLVAQVTNPIHLERDEDGVMWHQPKWRKLVTVNTYTEKGKKWVELRWDRQPGDSCNFTGCTVESNACEIQFTKEEYKKIK